VVLAQRMEPVEDVARCICAGRLPQSRAVRSRDAAIHVACELLAQSYDVRRILEPNGTSIERAELDGHYDEGRFPGLPTRKQRNRLAIDMPQPPLLSWCRKAPREDAALFTPSMVVDMGHRVRTQLPRLCHPQLSPRATSENPDEPALLE
jgi:hypothetical protein